MYRWRGVRLGAVVTVLLVGLVAVPHTSADDQVGIFFDQAAEENCIQATQTLTLDAYLLLLEPTSASVYGWECALEIDNAFMLEINFAGQAVNGGTGSNYIVGLINPLPASRAVQLARLSIMVMADSRAGFHIFPTSTPSLPGTPAYADGSDPSILVPMTPKTIGADALVAGINLPNCIPEETTWGRVKVIYD
jgi:hypothetical protein